MPGSRNEGLSRPNWYCPREAQLVPGPRSCTPPSGRPEREVSYPALHGAGVPGSSTGGRGPRSRCSSGAGSRASPLGRDMSSPRRLLVNSCHGRSVSTAGSRLRSSCVGLAPPLRPMQFCIVEGHHVAGVPAGMTLSSCSLRGPAPWSRSRGPGELGVPLACQHPLSPWNRCNGWLMLVHSRGHLRSGRSGTYAERLPSPGFARTPDPDLVRRRRGGTGVRGFSGPGSLLGSWPL